MAIINPFDTWFQQNGACRSQACPPWTRLLCSSVQKNRLSRVNTIAQPQAGDAAEAFEHLTQEVAVLHHTVEELVDAFQLKEPPDYSSTLGEIARDLGSIRERLDQIERHSAIRMTPVQHQRAIVDAGEGLIHNALQKLDQAAAEAAQGRRELAGLIGSARTQDRQFKWITGHHGGGVDRRAHLVIFPRAAVAVRDRRPNGRHNHGDESLERRRCVDGRAKPGGLARSQGRGGAADARQQSGGGGMSRCYREVQCPLRSALSLLHLLHFFFSLRLSPLILRVELFVDGDFQGDGLLECGVGVRGGLEVVFQ
jgi:hypothetical protein